MSETAFHFGRSFDAAARAPGDAPVLYPAKHLVTHGVIAGMTGSGKTGLATVLLEEAALAGIPAIAIDPKGDLGNLLLAFPSLAPEAFAPFVPAGEDPVEVARRAREGLAASDQSVEKLARFAACERALYTPGARLARPLSLMPSLGAPPPGTDEEGARDRAIASASALLSLARVDADPVRSTEHALVANVLLHAWSRGAGLDPAGLLRAIQAPPFERLGVMDLESVVPARARQALAVRLNAALASPSMAGMLEGEPLDVARLFRTADGRPRLSILSIAHLTDAERMFFVTALLGEVIAWMRAQEGANQLRAILYMDEIAGFFPPVAAPPSKAPMLTLLKQARAFGLGVVLATQNPVDLDYKGLSNCGTWMLGRLQTERDKLRVLDGLESLERGGLDRARLDALLSGLGQRVFVLHDVHAGPPRVMQVRWALSYLRGPLSREQMRALSPTSAPVPAASSPVAPPASRSEVSEAPPPVASATSGARPVLPAEIAESFVVRSDVAARAYRPGLAIRASVHYVDAKLDVDTWLEPALLVPLEGEGPRWESAWWLAAPLPESREPLPGVPFAALPGIAARAKSYAAWEKALIAHVVKDRPLVLLHAPDVDLLSAPGEPRDAFQRRLVEAARRARDEALRALESKWAGKIEKAREKLTIAERRLADASVSSNVDLLDAGADVLGALVSGRRSVARAGAAAARRTARAGERRERAREQVATARSALERLERDYLSARADVEDRLDPARLRVEERRIPAKRANVRVDRLALVWVPSPA